MKTKGTEEWRKYFKSGNCSIYEIIFNAIRMAALDNPVEFKLERKKIVEGLYASLFTDNVNDIATYEQANDANVIISCVLQIKDGLEKNQLSEIQIYESLRRLQLVVSSADIIKATGIGSTISDLKSHRSKEISLLATTIADQWESMNIAELEDKSAETNAEKCKSPMPSSVQEDQWKEFPTVEYVPDPPVEISENFLDDLDEHENGADDKNKNESDEEKQEENNGDGKEMEKEVKNVEVKIENDSDEELEKGRTNNNEASNNKRKVVVKAENNVNEDTGDTKRALRMRNKRKVEESKYMLRSIKQEYDDEDQKPSKFKIPKTENPSHIRDEKPIGVKKEVQDDNAEPPRATHRSLRMNAGPTPASTPRARKSRGSSFDTPRRGGYRALRMSAHPTPAAIPRSEKLETSKKKLQEGYQAHTKANKRSVQLIIPEEELRKKASTSRSKKQTRK